MARDFCIKEGKKDEELWMHLPTRQIGTGQRVKQKGRTERKVVWLAEATLQVVCYQAGTINACTLLTWTLRC